MVQMNRPEDPLIETHVVRFYLISEGGPPHGPPSLFDARLALNEINALPLSNEDGVNTRYQHERSGKSLHSVIDRSTDPLRFRLCEVNREYLPQAEKEGVVGDIPLEEGQGLLDSSHGVVFMPGLIGAIIGNGPRMTRLRRYIGTKCGLGRERLQIAPLIAVDVLDRIRRLETLSLFHFRISPSQLPIIRGRWEDLDEALKSQLAIWNEQTALEVIVRPLRDSRRDAKRTITDFLTSLASNEVRSMLSPGSVYKIRGRLEGHGHDVMLNVLSESLTTEEEVERIDTRHSALNSGSAYCAIERAFAALQPDIEMAMMESNVRPIEGT